MPRAILAGWLVLFGSIVVSFAFVVVNGGLSLSVAVAPTPEPSVAAANESAPAVPTPAAPTESANIGSPVPTEPTPTTEPSPAPTANPPAASIPTPTPRPSGTPPTTRPSATPVPATTGSGPSASRMALLTQCPDATDCYLYAIRSGDNLYSIANWFGVPYRTILAMNPGLQPSLIRAGQRIRIPTPTR